MLVMIFRNFFILLISLNLISNSYCDDCEDEDCCILPKINRNNSTNKSEQTIENNDKKEENDNKININNE